jgi:periplasmic protein TonB
VKLANSVLVVRNHLRTECEESAPLRAGEHQHRFLTSDLQEPWFRSFCTNLRAVLKPEKLPPLAMTSRPVMVQEIWGQYAAQKKCWAMSIGFQTVMVLLLFTVFSVKPVQRKVAEVISLIGPDIAPYVPKLAPKEQKMSGGGGGGDHSPMPASKGRLPKPALRQFTPPVTVPTNPNPKLTMDPSLIIPPDVPLPQVNLPNYGDPLARIGPLSNGPGSGGGIGSGSGGGVGPGKGGGFGPGEGGGTGGGSYGIGGGVFRVGGGVSSPVLLYKVEPEYSEEARKAKYQGTVVVYAEVEPSGRAVNLRILQSLGLGLDEKALEAIQKWRFRPGYKDGKPVTVIATIEVNFRLL